MKQRGVTLIQMLSALAVATLLTQIGLPAYARMSDDLQRAAVARDLAQALRSARSHALLQGQPVLVQALDGNWGNGWRVALEHNRQVLREQRLARPLWNELRQWLELERRVVAEGGATAKAIDYDGVDATRCYSLRSSSLDDSREARIAG